MEDAGENVPRHLQPVAGGAADPHRRAGPCQKAGDDERRQQLPHPRLRRGGIGFFDSFVHSRSSSCQALAQRVADALDDHDGDKEDDQDHAKAVVFAPADLFIHNEAQSARAHIAEDGGVAHVALQTEQGHGQIGRQHLRKDGGGKGAQARSAQRLHRLVGSHIHRFDDLKELLAHIGKGENGDGTGARHGAETENVGGDQGAHQRRQGAHQTQKTVRLPAHPTGLALAIIDFSVYPKNGFFVSSALKFCPTADLEK